MANGFVGRRWWAVALVTLVVGPFIGMLYIGRARLAFAYLALSFVFVGTLIVFFAPGLIQAHGELGKSLISDLPINLIGAVHGAMLVRRHPVETLPRYSRWYSLIAIWLLFPLSAFGIRTFLVMPYNAVSASMSPTLNIGDYVFVSRRSYDGAGPERGDLVVFRAYESDFIKRVVGVGGDRVRMAHGVLILNGKPVARRRIEDYRDGFPQPVHQYLETLPSGRSYRTLDIVEGSPIDDTQEFVVPAGHYFVLGDNRDNSDDSRLDIGFVARGDVIGRIAIKFADAKHSAMVWEKVD